MPVKPTKTADQALVRELLHRQECRDSLEQWFLHALRDLGHIPATHHLYIIRHLEMLAKGTIKRLMISVPPGHGKSILASQLFPAWFLAQSPNLKIIGASHTQSLAEDISTKVRGLITDNAKVLGYDLREDSRSRERWKTTNGGEYLSASTGKKLAGNRAQILVIDDACGSRAEAESEVESDKLFHWFHADAKTRLLPDGRIVIIATRWTVNDLPGRLLEQDASQWTVINLPAFAEEDDALGRSIGDPLWPDYFDKAYLDDMKAGMTSRDWSALYQQHPRPEEGNLFKTDNLQRVSGSVDGLSVRCWDLAASTSKFSDWTVGLKLTRRPDGTYHIADVVRFRGTPEEVEARMVNTAQIDGLSVSRIIIPQDPGAAGKMAARYLTKALAGYRVEVVGQSGDKVSRAGPVVSQTNMGNITMAFAGWNDDLIAELENFPNAKHDDIVDALSGAFNGLADVKKPVRLGHLNWMAR